MTDRRYSVGEKALVSRDESGENHEEATVVDYYILLIGEESRPMVVVDFGDGERKWMSAVEPNVLPIEPEEELEVADEPDGAGESGGDLTAQGDAVADDGDDPAPAAADES
jgi:hypothetical protein